MYPTYQGTARREASFATKEIAAGKRGRPGPGKQEDAERGIHKGRSKGHCVDKQVNMQTIGSKRKGRDIPFRKQLAMIPYKYPAQYGVMIF